MNNPHKLDTKKSLPWLLRKKLKSFWILAYKTFVDCTLHACMCVCTTVYRTKMFLFVTSIISPNFTNIFCSMHSSSAVVLSVITGVHKCGFYTMILLCFHIRSHSLVYSFQPFPEKTELGTLWTWHETCLFCLWSRQNRGCILTSLWFAYCLHLCYIKHYLQDFPCKNQETCGSITTTTTITTTSRICKQFYFFMC